MNILTVLKRATRKTKSSTQQSGILKAIPSEVTEWIVYNIGSKITSVDFSRLNDHWLSRGLFTWRLKWIKKWRVTGQGLAIGELACDVYYYHYYNYHHYHHHHHHHYIIIIIKAALSNCRTNRKGTPIKQRSRECCLCGQDKDTVGCSASLCQFFFIFAKTGSFDHFVPTALTEMRKFWTWSVLWRFWKVLEENNLQLVPFSNPFESMYIKQSFSSKFPTIEIQITRVCVGLGFYSLLN